MRRVYDLSSERQHGPLLTRLLLYPLQSPIQVRAARRIDPGFASFLDNTMIDQVIATLLQPCF
jgi:hypothetical protein